ncbi:ATP-binding transport protein SmoK [Rubrivivax sp. A210]|uniref:ABC transporter ATP-binding protein n=1 Tax=Rubrivivax sp. A210 TaxID=2772301 RepID=UPI00191929E7|nr:ABC transporter ATP-binding protein [Rubrivivax sp. A210]CAD5372775.1 ATP-binding transport protein SmoK [Rubrivivax sp. A210]
MGQVRLSGLRKSYGDTHVIKGIDLEVKDGEFLVFVGPSGCGKSTTLRMIAGLEDISGGEISIDGQRVNELRPADRGTAMVFQSYALYPHMTVAENMGFALEMSGVAKAERRLQVGRAAEILRITELLARYPKELSGGQRQRVAIGRAIVRKPRVFLFDEPLSNLDAALRVNMRIELTRLHKELGTTMIYVTHDQVEAMTMGDRIAVFNKGHVEQLGAPMALYTRPANEFVATFIGAPRINLVDRPGADASAAHRALWAAVAGQAPAQTQRAGLRPEHLRLVAAAQGIPARVALAEHLGDSSIIHLRVDGLAELLSAKVGAEHGGIAAGQDVGLVPDAAWALAFDAEQRLAA